MRIVLVYSALLFSLLAVAASAQTVVIRIIDGDTFMLLHEGETQTFRLLGIDAGETGQNESALRSSIRTERDPDNIVAMGTLARIFVETVVGVGDTVLVEFDEEMRGPDGILQGYLYTRKGDMLNELLLREGLAYTLPVPPNVRYAERFAAAREEAEEQGKGIWRK